jgi:hypothetical protein
MFAFNINLRQYGSAVMAVRDEVVAEEEERQRREVVREAPAANEVKQELAGGYYNDMDLM